MIHGKVSTYVHRKCRCELCSRAKWRYDKRLRASGPRTVPADRAAAHVKALVAAGLTRCEIARRAGVSRTRVDVLAGINYRGEAVRVDRRVEAAVLAVTVTPAPPRAGLVPAIGPRRRIQALSAIGWEQNAVAAEAGISTSCVGRIRLAEWTSSSAAEAIARAYDRLSMTPGTSTRALSVARRKCWLPPLAWDDDRIDDPTYTPDPGVLRGPDDPGRIDPAEVLDLIDLGASVTAIADRFGTEPTYIRRVLRRASQREAS